MIGGLFIYNHKGEVLISRVYRDDIGYVSHPELRNLGWVVLPGSHNVLFILDKVGLILKESGLPQPSYIDRETLVFVPPSSPLFKHRIACISEPIHMKDVFQSVVYLTTE